MVVFSPHKNHQVWFTPHPINASQKKHYEVVVFRKANCFIVPHWDWWGVLIFSLKGESGNRLVFFFIPVPLCSYTQPQWSQTLAGCWIAKKRDHALCSAHLLSTTQLCCCWHTVRAKPMEAVNLFFRSFVANWDFLLFFSNLICIHFTLIGLHFFTLSKSVTESGCSDQGVQLWF